MIPQSHKSRQYFEGILQLRNPTQEIVNFVADEIYKQNNKVWIARSAEHDNGIDLYLSSNRFLLEIGRRLQKRFTGEMIITKKLHTVDKMSSKLLYRGTVLFRHFNFKKGDIIHLKGDDIEILRITNEVLGKNIKTGAKMHIKFEVIRKQANLN